MSHLSPQSGALLACGIVNSGVRNECDPALALLSDYVLHNSNIMRIGAIFGWEQPSRNNNQICESLTDVDLGTLNVLILFQSGPSLRWLQQRRCSVSASSRHGRFQIQHGGASITID